MSVRYVQWIPRLGTHEERLAVASESGCHHDYHSALVEIPAPAARKRAGGGPQRPGRHNHD